MRLALATAGGPLPWTTIVPTSYKQGLRVNALKKLLFLPLLLAPGAALAAPATMLVVVRSATSSVTTIPFPSMADCDAAADHLAKVRTPNESTLGVGGAWKANFRYGQEGFRQEPRISTLCLPGTSEIPGVAEILIQKGWYKDLYK
jgi:hypothetical protein